MNFKKTFHDLVLTEKRGRVAENSISLASQLLHFLTFQVQKPKSTGGTAILILSIDVDVGNSKLGIINAGKNDANVHKCHSEAFIGSIEAFALPMFVQALNNSRVQATFAVRGQIAEVDAEIINCLSRSPVKHDIGAHGYSHRNFVNLSRKEAEFEVRMASHALNKVGVKPQSFVFPRNGISHLELLEAFGFKCYREDGSFRTDGMFIEKKGALYNIHPSLYLNQTVTPLILKRILDVAIYKKAPLHLWFHCWNFGETRNVTKQYIDKVFSPFLNYIMLQEKKGLLAIETMCSAAEKADNFEK